MYNLFTKFPIISYNGQLAINLIPKIKFTEAAKKTGAVYYPYTIEEGERPDIIAANYYDDARYSWLIYMVNDIVDPYYDWPLDDSQFKEFIVKKYGSIETATESIAFWRVNWYEDETRLTTAGYEALPSYSKKYFRPIEGSTGLVVAYDRSKIDYAVETNKIQHLTVSSTTGYNVGEQVNQKTSGVVSGTAFVKQVLDSTTLIVHNVLGAFAATAGSVGNVIGKASAATSALSAMTTTSTPIPSNETAYWSYVTHYDYENELNEQKRHIKLLDKMYVDQVEKELDDLL
jgi:hypothetical protein